jgi:hypothetical protein
LKNDKSSLLVATATNDAAEKYRWVIPKLPKDLSSIEKSKIAVGLIDRQKYVAMQLDEESPIIGNWVLLVISKINADQSYTPISIKKFYPLEAPTIRIEKNSIYIRSDIARHGVYSVEQQFKLRKGEFRIVGSTWQSITLSTPDSRPEPDRWKGETLEMWEGSNSNYLNLKEIRWKQALRGGSDRKAVRKAHELFYKGLMPVNAAKRYARLKPAKLLALEDPIIGEMNKK